MFQIALDESTAALRRFPFKCVSSADHITPLTGLSFSAGEIKISENGAAEANHAGTVTELAGGGYYYEAAAAEVNTQGFLTFRTGGSLKAGLDVVFERFQIGPFGTTATVNLKQLSVINSGGSAIVASSTGSNGHGIAASGNGSGEGLSATGGATGHGIEAIGGASSGSGMSISATAGSTHGLQVSGFLAGSGIKATGGETGHGLDVQGGATSGDGLHATAPTSGDGIEAVGAGGGADINADITGNITGNLSGSIGSLGATAKTDVNTEVDTALSDINLNDLIQLSGTVNDAGATTTVFIISAGFSATNDFYNGMALTFTSGTLAGLSRRVEDYVGATKTITLSNALPSAPANGVGISIVGLEISASGTGPTAAQVADAVWDEVRGDHVTAGTFGQGAASVQGNVTGNVAGSVASVVGAVGSVAADGITASSIAADAIGSSELAATAVTEIVQGIWGAARATYVATGTMGQTQAILLDGTATAGGATTITINIGAASSVDDFYNNAYIQIIGGTGVGQSRFITDYTGATKVCTVDTWVTNPDNTSVFIIRPFYSLPGSSAPTAAQVADAVWDELRADHTTAATFGQGVASVQGNVTGTVASVVGAVGGNVTGSVGSLAAQAQTDVQTASNAALVALNLDHLVKAAVDTNFATTVHLDSVLGQMADNGTSATFDRTTDSLEALQGQSFPTLAAIVDGVWDELRADHTANGTFGQGAASVQGNVAGSVASVTGAVGSVTGNVGGNVVGSVASVAGSVAGNVTGSVGSVVGNVGGNIVGSVASVVGNVGGNVVGSVASVTGNVAGNVTGSIGSLATQAKADVNTEVVDVLRVDALAELSTLPSATPTFHHALMFLYQEERNESTQTATLKSVKDSGGTTIAHSNISDDGTTLTKSKYIAGP